MIRVVLPAPLRTLAGIDGELRLHVAEPVTPHAILDALEAMHPALRGTIRNQVTLQRRAYVRYFAGGEDVSHDPADKLLPPTVTSGADPFIVLGAISGG